MCALTVRMLVRQPMMLFSFVFIKWIPDLTLILPKRGEEKKEVTLQKCTNIATGCIVIQHKTGKARQDKIFLWNNQVVFKIRSN